MPDKLTKESQTPTKTAKLLAHAVAELGGTLRQGQLDMAVATAQAMENGRHLLVQAGTGTGKSLGYLVPAICLLSPRPLPKICRENLKLLFLRDGITTPAYTRSKAGIPKMTPVRSLTCQGVRDPR